jgi:hypothetical protein
MTFYTKFTQTLLYNVATITAVIVGILSFILTNTKQWYHNGGKEQLMNTACKIMYFINHQSEKLYFKLSQ